MSSAFSSSFISGLEGWLGSEGFEDWENGGKGWRRAGIIFFFILSFLVLFFEGFWDFGAIWTERCFCTFLYRFEGIIENGLPCVYIQHGGCRIGRRWCGCGKVECRVSYTVSLIDYEITYFSHQIIRDQQRKSGYAY